MKDTVRVVSEEDIEGLLAGVDEGRAPTLLLATDGSFSARLAAVYAAELAHRTDAIVVAVHVIDDDGVLPEKSAADAGSAVVEDANAIVGEWRVRCDTVLADGEPARTIARLAERVEADCVVLGAGSGRGPGYVAERVGEGCNAPVLAVGGDKSPRGLGRDRGQR